MHGEPARVCVGRLAARLSTAVRSAGRYNSTVPKATRSYRIRAYPNGAQQRILDHWFGASRWLWNTALAIRSEGYRHCALRLTSTDLSRWLTQWKRTAGHEWLADVPASCLTQALRDQDRAFANFFAKRARYPKFKSRVTAGALRFQGIGRTWERGALRIPKLGSVKLAETLPEVPRPGMVTLRRDAVGRYFATFSAEVEAAVLPGTGRAIGIDLGLTHLATLSSGEKVGARLVREFDTICIEDLNVKAMARGMHSRSIHDAAFGEFRRQLTYKASWYGRTVIACDRWYPSSKICSRCGHKIDELRLDVREWDCPKCRSHHDRDINAAQNVLNAGMHQLAGRDGRDLRAEAEDPCTLARAARVSAVEARSGQITANGTVRKLVI
jgi:putative transposase